MERCYAGLKGITGHDSRMMTSVINGGSSGDKFMKAKSVTCSLVWQVEKEACVPLRFQTNRQTKCWCTETNPNREAIFQAGDRMCWLGRRES